MILIVGAGPVGLTAGLELARRGIAFRIVDKADSPSKLSKAIGVNPRSLELLEPSGACAALLESGTKISRANLHDDNGVLTTLNFQGIGHRHNFMLALPQSRTEAVLTDKLQSLGVQVERGCALTRLTVHDGKAQCLLETGDRRSELNPSLVIGADGAHSLVRESLRIPFAGRTYDRDWSLVDLRLDWSCPDDEVNLFVTRRGLLAVIPMGPGRYRLASDRPDPVTLLPGEANPRAVLWRSSFRIAHRQAKTYRNGPVCLAGDAAHVHSPLGARGMNLGIEDAAVLAQLVAEDQLHRYHDLRYPVGRRTIVFVNLLTRALAARGTAARLSRRFILATLLNIASFRQRMTKNMLGIAAPPPTVPSGTGSDT